jgi:hypothetical protein
MPQISPTAAALGRPPGCLQLMASSPSSCTADTKHGDVAQSYCGGLLGFSRKKPDNHTCIHLHVPTAASPKHHSLTSSVLTLASAPAEWSACPALGTLSVDTAVAQPKCPSGPRPQNKISSAMTCRPLSASCASRRHRPPIRGHLSSVNPIRVDRRAQLYHNVASARQPTTST